MGQHHFVWPIDTAIILALVGMVFFNWLNQPIKGSNFTKMTIFLNRDKEGPYVITEKDIIDKYIKKINTSSKKDITKIQLEHGPDGRIIFDGKKTVEVKVFSNGGNVVTDKFLIDTVFNFDKIINKE